MIWKQTIAAADSINKLWKRVIDKWVCLNILFQQTIEWHTSWEFRPSFGSIIQIHGMNLFFHQLSQMKYYDWQKRADIFQQTRLRS